MRDNPKVSVIIATHNHAHFLPACLGSVKAQTYKDYEVVIVNNGATDNTKEVVDQLAWDAVRYHYQENTGSVAGPRNTGIQLAKGDYVAFLDSDDTWYPEKLEKAMTILENNPDIDILSHDLYMLREGKKKQRIAVGPGAKNMFKALLKRNTLLGSATVVKRDVIIAAGLFDGCAEFVHTEDYETWLRIAYLGKKFYFLNEVLGEYLVHAANLSFDFEAVLAHEKNVIEKHFKNLKSDFPLERFFLYRSRMAVIYSKMAIQYFFRKQYQHAIQCFLKAFWLNPIKVCDQLLSVLRQIPK